MLKVQLIIEIMKANIMVLVVGRLVVLSLKEDKAKFVAPLWEGQGTFISVVTVMKN